MTQLQQFQRSPQVREVAERIISQYRPLRLYLYNHRADFDGELGSFKLCVILETDEKFRVERDICLSIDSDIPYDVLVYTPDEWEEIAADPHSFASKIKQTGVVLYDKA